MRLTQKLAGFRQPGNLYLLLKSFAGMLLFAATGNLSINSYSMTQWVIIYSMVGAVLLLSHFIFALSPEGNGQSMDSSVYLAALFLYGGGVALFVLLLSSVVFMIYARNTKWWKHILNFSMYTFMINGAGLTFHLLGGETGPFNINYMYAYLVALAAYFTLNVILFGCYYLILYKGSVFKFLKNIMRDILFAYLSTLLLSVVLVILMAQNGSLGLFLFLAIGILLSHAFQQLFKMYNSVSEKANTDQRTGLYSHSCFEEKLDEAIKVAKKQESPLSLAMIDLDDFKKYNDTFGHLQGDRLLGFFGELVKSECESKNFIAARFGGEEFAIIMPGFTQEQSKAFIDGLRKKINDSPFDGVEIFPHGCLSYSAGIIELRKEMHDKSQLIDWADRAVYAAKSKGKNMVLIYGEESRLPQRLEDDIKELEQQLKIFLSKDVYTFKHSKRVYSYAVDMADVLKLNDANRRLLVLGALIHDIGKLEIPRDILNKKSKLTSEEWEIVKKHVLWGKEIVLVNGKYKDLVPLVELHHERYDGKGYPYGYKGEEIPLLARMLCIIDSFDAMTTERPYQATKSFADALQEIRNCAGSQFDPELAAQFIRYMENKMAPTG
ncbi:diguanylate cyclase [Paenibacillus sp. sptzw28]|uniref:bifunctional diguanylate cyclase/phosphohydrolase n=1 Tax=Paenibacillus sp. sptzw28 TaxID=715179 RepID=UPI001C6F476F|nr:diguanylate cyclase [Paenibacillus sp. sptzw28]